MNPQLERTITGVFFVAIFALLLRKLTDYDIWYHLAIGREIIRTWSIPATEFLTYSTTGQPTSYHEWGYGVLAYLTEHLFGDLGLSIFNALLTTVTLYALAAAARIATANQDAFPLLRGLVIVGAIAVAQFRFVYRPEMMLFVVAAVSIYALERYRTTASWRTLTVLPIAAGLLSQFHPSALFLVAIVGAYGAEAVIAADRKSRWLELRNFALISIAMVALATLNPYGWEQVWLPIRFAMQSELLEGITEFLPALQTPLALEFVITALAGVAAIALQRPFRIAHALLYVVFAVLTYQHVRNLALLAIVSVVPVATLLTQRLGGIFSSAHRQVALGSAIGVAAAALFYQALAAGEWGAGPATGIFPIAAAEELNQIPVPGRIFNFYDTGGYRAWRAESTGRVFIDGRHYEADVILQQHNAVFSAAPTWHEILRQYKVGSIVTPTTLRYSGALIPLIVDLTRSPDWVPTAIDGGGVLFVLRAFARHQLPTSAVWEKTLEVAGGIYGAFPDQIDALRTMSIAYHELGKISPAIETLESYVKRNPEDDESKVLLAQWRAESNAAR